MATVTANPCIDKTVSVENFDVYKANRARLIRTDPGGKGINVSRALNLLGVKTTALGFNFTDGADIVENTLRAEGIAEDFVKVSGKLRTCTKIFDESAGHMIELNEYGSAVTKADESALTEKVVRAAKDCRIIVLSGSMPGGISDDFYFRCIEQIKKASPDVKTVVDAQGETLLLALQAAPYLIKPNIHEFTSTFGFEINSEADLDKYAKEVLKKYSIGIVCVSLGANGAYITDGERSYIAEAVKVPVRSLQGAGDSMVAGICLALSQGLSLVDVLKYSLASSAATIQHLGTQFGKKEEFEKILSGEFSIKEI